MSARRVRRDDGDLEGVAVDGEDACDVLPRLPVYVRRVVEDVRRYCGIHRRGRARISRVAPWFAYGRSCCRRRRCSSLEIETHLLAPQSVRYLEPVEQRRNGD